MKMAFKDFVKTVKSEAGDAVEVTKLKAKISKEKANIKETYEAIGEIFYNKVKEGAQMDPEFSPLVEKIDAAKTQRGVPSSNSGVLYLILCLFVPIVAWALMQNELNNMAN